MKIDGKRIAKIIIDYLGKKAKKLKKPPFLAVFLVNDSDENLSFVKVKETAVKKISGKFQLFHFKQTPDFESFANKLKQVAEDPNVDGVIVQQPLPPSLSTESLFNYIPTKKEIEGHKKKSPFFPPLGLAVMTIIKYIFKAGDKTNVKEIIFRPKKDLDFFKRVLKRKKIVLIGRGKTGGQPIGQTLSSLKINFINVHSQTPNAQIFYQDADIIISAVGKKILTKEVLKPRVILISVGLRKEENKWKGDYDENEIKNVASFYTPTPGGLGPLDIAYLLYNLVEANKISTSWRTKQP